MSTETDTKNIIVSASVESRNQSKKVEGTASRFTNDLETISNKTDIKDTTSGNTSRNNQGSEQQNVGSGVRNTVSATIKTNAGNSQAESGAGTVTATMSINNNTKDPIIMLTATNGGFLHKLSNGGHVTANDWSMIKNDVSQMSITKRYNVNGVDIIEGMPTKDIIDIPRIRQSQQIDPHSEIFPEDTSLFIGDLSRHVSEEHMLGIFSQFGEVEHVDIKRDKVTKNNLGYGFVTFKNRDQAEQAKRNMHGMEIGGRTIRIGWAQKNTNLFVGDLDSRIDAEHLKIIFKQFGPIYNDDTFVKRNGYGFVKFKHRTHAEKAKATLDGKFLTIPGTNQQTERPIRIGWGDANTQRNCVHVQFDSAHGAQVDLKESDFNEVFQQFGVVVKVSLPRFPDKKLKGYGFIHFEENDDGEEAAARAITTLSFGKINGVTIQCNFGKRQNQRHKRFNKHFRSNQFDEEMDDMGESQNSGNEINSNNRIMNSGHNTGASYEYLNNPNSQIPRIGSVSNRDTGISSTVGNRNSEGAAYTANRTMLEPTVGSFSNQLASTTTLPPSLTQFTSLPPGPYLAPPAMYGKTLEALAAVSPNYVPFGKPSPSPAMLSPPNLPNAGNFAGLSPPNPTPMNQSASNVLLQLSSTLPTNITAPTSSIQPSTTGTNFANLVAFLPQTSLSGLHQSLSPNWGATGLNSVTSIPSINNHFTASPSMNISKTGQPSNPYGNFPISLNGLNLSPPNLPVKDNLVNQR